MLRKDSIKMEMGNVRKTSLSLFGEPLEQEWQYITSELDVPDHLSQYWFDRIKLEYSRFGRLYHNSDHLRQCFQFKHSLKHEFKQDLNISIALWFHDYVYWCGSKNNEKESAEVANSFLDTLPNKYPHNRDDINCLIWSTTHDASSYSYASAYKDLAYFLDIDLSILGESPTLYDKYANSVREEYLFSGVTPTDYSKGRYNFLDSLLKKDKIFHTKEVQAILEEQARVNIKEEMKLYEQR